MDNQTTINTQRASRISAQRQNVEKLETLAKKTEEILLRVKTVFPFDFFPDEIIVDKNKINIIRKYFFLTSLVESVMIDNISDLELGIGPIFATLRIIHLRPTEPPILINHLWKKDALKVRRVIQGLILARREHVDITDINGKTLVETAEKVGRISQDI